MRTASGPRIADSEHSVNLPLVLSTSSDTLSGHRRLVVGSRIVILKAMTYPRSHLVDPDGGVYHVCSRCVRRAFLCGTDRQTGYNFDHRQAWIEERILWLASIFAADIYGYAVMSNHYHLVLSVKANTTKAWTDEMIVDKWLMLNPRKNDNPIARQVRRLSMLEDDDRLHQLRERLGSLSWFMRYLNEPLARLANKEDACKGRFWEGRFKSQRLLDEQAILACMVYVDLNPVRAGLVDEPTEANHTSLANRCKKATTSHLPMTVVNRVDIELPISITLDAYRRLCSWTIEIQQVMRPTNFEGVPPPDLWRRQYLPKPGCWQRAIGSVQSMKDYAREIGQCWIKTVSA
ncbi:MAG: hypothetical protein VB957_13610 [Pseudomonadales bacterium]